MSVLSVKNTRRLSLGIPGFDDVFSGFEFGNFAVISGHDAHFMSFVLSVRSQLPQEKGGLNSSVCLVDGGNTFNPYLVAEIARSEGLDSRSVLEGISISRAFTVFQLSSLVLEEVEPFLRKRKSKLLVISDITSLFLDENIHDTEAEDLFTEVCVKLSGIATEQRIIVIASLSEKKSRRSLFFESILRDRSDVLVNLKRKKRAQSFSLERHPRVKQFSIDLPMADFAPLSAFREA